MYSFLYVSIYFVMYRTNSVSSVRLDGDLSQIIWRPLFNKRINYSGEVHS